MLNEQKINKEKSSNSKSYSYCFCFGRKKQVVYLGGKTTEYFLLID